MGEMMKSSNYIFNDIDKKYFVQTRGKLTQHQISVFSSFVLYDKILIYLVSIKFLKQSLTSPGPQDVLNHNPKAQSKHQESRQADNIRFLLREAGRQFLHRFNFVRNL